MILIYGKKRLEYNIYIVGLYMCVEFVPGGNTQENPPSDTACVALRARAKNKKIKKQQESKEKTRKYMPERTQPTPGPHTHAQSSPKTQAFGGVSCDGGGETGVRKSIYLCLWKKRKKPKLFLLVFYFPVRQRLSSSCSSLSREKDGRVSTLFCWLLLFGWQWRRRTPTPFL